METYQLKYEKILKKNEELREELLELKSINFDKVFEKIKNDGFVKDVSNLQIKILENKLRALKKENEFLKTTLKKQLAKQLYFIINNK